MELFSRGHFLVAVGRDLDLITQAETLEAYRGLREDLLRTTYAYYLAELADAFTAEHDENRPLFDLLRDALGWLASSPDLRLVARYYELHLLGLVGYQPQLFVCPACKEQLRPVPNYLSLPEGGVLCPRCASGQPNSVRLSVNALKVLRFLQTRSWETCSLLRLTPGSHAQVERALEHYIAYHLERKPRSVEFLHHLRRQMASAGPGVGRVSIPGIEE